MRSQPIHLTTLLLLALIAIGLQSTIAAAAPAREASTALPAPKEPVKEKDRVQEVSFSRDGRSQKESGRILVEATDGGVLLETDDGTLWTLEGNEVVSRLPTEEEFKPLTQQEIGEKVLAELPAGFRVHTTPHYVVVYDTSRQYALWVSSLLERLHKAFTSYWENEGLEVHEPEFPLVAMVFADRRTYDQMSRTDLPGGVGNIVGFYSLRSNRVNMFDLTGAEAVRGAGGRGSMREINDMLSQPAAVPLVATIVHEATHQIAFNCGLQTRFADLPLWLCEGMAVYFEAPDLASTRGWRGIGKVNYPRLETFRKNLGSWNDDTLVSLISDDRRLRDPKRAVDAYADAWALNYYLIKYQPKAYAAYLKALSKKPPLVEDAPAARLAEFRQHFGDPRRLEQDFLKQMGRVK